MYYCTWVPRLLKIFLLGTCAAYSLRDGNVPGMMGIRQKAHGAEGGSPTRQPPGFPSGAVLGAFPGLANWREGMFPYHPQGLNSAPAFLPHPQLMGKREVRGILLNPACWLFLLPFSHHLEQAEGKAGVLMLQFASYCAFAVPKTHKFLSPS